jgi:hypothetical protein
MNDEALVQELKEFGVRLARLSPEEIEQRRWAKWIAQLRRIENPAWEDEQDRHEGDTYW